VSRANVIKAFFIRLWLEWSLLKEKGRLIGLNDATMLADKLHHFIIKNILQLKTMHGIGKCTWVI